MEALLEAAVRLATPLLIAALGELVVERAGVINIGIEGMMLTGAFASFALAAASGSPLLGAAGGVAAGAAAGALFALFAVVRKGDQIVVGMALNLLALGATGLGSRTLWGGAPPDAPAQVPASLAGLAEIPLAGAVLFQQTPFVYTGWALAAGIAFFLARTRFGLRLRAVGESARAADAEGVAVDRVRFGAVLFGAGLAGLAGASLSLAHSETFTEGMTAGRGFIALAVVIFGRWRPGGVLLAALFFGAATALQFRLQARGSAIPYPVFLMFPYLVTLVVLTFVSSGSRAPADLGRAYHRA